MMFFFIFQNIVVGTPVCQYATAEFRCWYTGGPIRGERVKQIVKKKWSKNLKNLQNRKKSEKSDFFLLKMV